MPATSAGMTPERGFELVGMPFSFSREQIRDTAAKRLRGDPQRVREFHDLDVDVVGDLRGTFVQWDRPVDAGGGLYQFEEFRLHPEDGVPGQPAKRCGKANELDGIAEAVIAAHQHALVPQRLASPDILQVPRPIPAALAAFEAAAQNLVADRPCRHEIATAHPRGPPRPETVRPYCIHTCRCFD